MKLLMIMALAILFSDDLLAQLKSIEEEIRNMENAETTAVLKRDTVALEEIWASDFTVNTPLNTIGTRKKDDKIRLFYSFLERKIEKLLIYNDKLVITMGSETVIPKDKMPMAGQVVHRRFTNVWMKQNGVWQLTARHANIICDSP